MDGWASCLVEVVELSTCWKLSKGYFLRFMKTEVSQCISDMQRRLTEARFSPECGTHNMIIYVT